MKGEQMRWEGKSGEDVGEGIGKSEMWKANGNEEDESKTGGRWRKEKEGEVERKVSQKKKKGSEEKEKRRMWRMKGKRENKKRMIGKRWEKRE